MRQYELTLIFKPQLTEEQADAIIEKLKLKIIHQQVWGKRMLAYPIEKEKEGLYVHVVVDLEQSSIPALEEKIRLNENIIRHLLVIAEKQMV
ncbi:MAG: 30S ribosomal protein S6 [Candidatus Roizmanbacteria bacterium]|nr:30S ribosomal protein S6 [Candidatus Roizmanbacteria bacterium]